MADGSGRVWPALDLLGPDLDRHRDDLLTILDDHHPAGVYERDPDAWCVFFAERAARDAAGDALALAFGIDRLRVEALDVTDPGWAAISQRQLTAIRIGRVVVAPPWDVPDRAPDDGVVVVIEPSMGFGTGHHASTRLCLRALQRLSVDGRRVVDLGTGSGLLAIAARALGAAQVTGIDWDPDAIDAARANLERNPGADLIRLVRGDVRDQRSDRAHIVLANLTAPLLVDGVARLLDLLDPTQGRAILSGFTVADEGAVRDAVEAGVGVDVVDRSTEAEWVAFILRVRR